MADMQGTEKCNTLEEYLPTDEEVKAAKRDYYILGGYDDDTPDPLGSVFLQRLELPMVVDSERAGREITLAGMDSVHRWAATEFATYEIGSL